MRLSLICIFFQVKLASQYYFYMEPQVVLAVPDEDNCMTVYAATQWPESTQGHIAKALGIPFHNVRVITRRIGGSFGAKAFRAMPVSLLNPKLATNVYTYF